MKKALIYTFLILALAFASANKVMAQPHPNQQSDGKTVDGTQRLGEGGAPVGNGTFILLTLAMAYAGRKWYTGNKTVTEEE